MKIKKLLKKCDTTFNKYIITDKDSGHGPTIYDRSNDVLADFGSWEVYGWSIEYRFTRIFDDINPSIAIHITV